MGSRQRKPKLDFTDYVDKQSMPEEVAALTDEIWELANKARKGSAALGAPCAYGMCSHRNESNSRVCDASVVPNFRVSACVQIQGPDAGAEPAGAFVHVHSPTYIYIYICAHGRRSRMTSRSGRADTCQPRIHTHGCKRGKHVHA